MYFHKSLESVLIVCFSATDQLVHALVTKRVFILFNDILSNAAVIESAREIT